MILQILMNDIFNVVRISFFEAICKQRLRLKYHTFVVNTIYSVVDLKIYYLKKDGIKSAS